MTLRKTIVLGGLILIVLGAGQALGLLSEVLTYLKMFRNEACTSLVYILIRSPHSALLFASGLFTIIRPDIIERLVEKISNRDANK